MSGLGAWKAKLQAEPCPDIDVANALVQKSVCALRGVGGCEAGRRAGGQAVRVMMGSCGGGRVMCGGGWRANNT